jgi:hypothetical protein
LWPRQDPTPILDRWNAEIVKVLNDDEVKKALLAHGLTPQPTTRQGLADFMKGIRPVGQGGQGAQADRQLMPHPAGHATCPAAPFPTREHPAATAGFLFDRPPRAAFLWRQPRIGLCPRPAAGTAWHRP